MFTRRHTAWVIVLVLLCALFWFLPPLAARQDEIYRTFVPLIEVKNMIEKRYVEPVTNDDLVEGAIRGMIRQLDEHSTYLSPREYPVFVEQTKGGYVGIGVLVEQRDGQLLVQSPLEGSPALAAGVRSGDIITQISGIPVDSRNISASAERLRGVEGSMAHFTVQRPPDGEIIPFSVRRLQIRTRSVRGFRRDQDGRWQYLIDPEQRIGYVRISDFWDNTLGEFRDAVSDLIDQRAKGLIVDVRFNTGGDMEVAVGVVDQFITEGVILMTKNRRQVQSQWEATAAGTVLDWPVVVLVNEVTASGAEILAGALQDHGRARVVGDRTYGKGSVQSIIEMEDGLRALKLTTAYYYLPSGRCIHRRPENYDTDEWGIIPDKLVKTTPPQMQEIYESWLRSAATSNDADEPHPAIVMDEQLNTALDLLCQALGSS